MTSAASTFCVIGIDPGANEAKPGGIAVWIDGDLSSAVDIPISAKELNDALLVHALRQILGGRSPHVVVIERVTKRPGMAHGMDKLFVCYGVIRGIVAAEGWRSERVMPGVWKRATNTTSGSTRGEKDEAARARASQLMPEHARLWPKKRHAGRATAALIAWYGAHKFVSDINVGRKSATRSTPTQEALL